MLGSWLYGGRAGPPAHDDYWYTPIGYQSGSGVAVTAGSAMQSSAVYGCVRLLSGGLSMLPQPVYRRLPGTRTLRGGKERAVDHPLYDVLRYRPNDDQTVLEWREMLYGHLLLRGNAYSEIISSATRMVDSLQPLHPDCVRPKRLDSGAVIYEYREPGSSMRVINADNMLHIRLWAPDGLSGLSPVAAFRLGIGVTLDAQFYKSLFFKSGSIPGGILTSDQPIDPNKAKEIRERWKALHTGVDKSHEIAVTGSGLKWQHVGMTHEDAQFLETIKATDRQISGHIYGVPPHMLGDTETSTSWGTGIEQQTIGLVTYTMQPLSGRFDQAINRSCLAPSEQHEFFAEHLFAGLLKGDLRSRYAAYAIAVNSHDPWLSKNEIREFENMNPIEGGDLPRVPLNTAPAGPGVRRETPPYLASDKKGSNGRNGEVTV